MSDEVPRCEKTGNPCGTDTWAVGYTCPCRACREYVANEAALASALSKDRHKLYVRLPVTDTIT